MNPATTLANLRAVQARTDQRPSFTDTADDDAAEDRKHARRCPSESDMDWAAARDEGRESRWREGT